MRLYCNGYFFSLIFQSKYQMQIVNSQRFKLWQCRRLEAVFSQMTVQLS
jgi:hypothetical protein